MWQLSSQFAASKHPVPHCPAISLGPLSDAFGFQSQCCIPAQSLVQLKVFQPGSRLHQHPRLQSWNLSQNKALTSVTVQTWPANIFFLAATLLRVNQTSFTVGIKAGVIAASKNVPMPAPPPSSICKSNHLITPIATIDQSPDQITKQSFSLQFSVVTCWLNFSSKNLSWVWIIGKAGVSLPTCSSTHPGDLQLIPALIWLTAS